MSETSRDPSPKLWLLLLAAVLFSPALVIVLAVAITRSPVPTPAADAAPVASASAVALTPGAAAWVTCAACHGPQGEGMVGLGGPALAGVEPWYLYGQMEAFRAGWRGTHPEDLYGQQMAPMAKALDDAAVDAVIAHIETFPPPATIDPVEGGDPAKGAIHYGVCAACHGFEGEGNEALRGPSLLGQHGWYLVRQIQGYQSGLRGTHPDDVYGRTMAPMAATLPDEQAIRDVVAYIQSLAEAE